MDPENMKNQNKQEVETTTIPTKPNKKDSKDKATCGKKITSFLWSALSAYSEVVSLQDEYYKEYPAAAYVRQQHLRY